MAKEVARPEGSAFELLKAAGNATERFAAGQYAITPVPVPGFTHPVPPLFFDMPWNDDDDEIVSGILANLAAAEDIVEATSAKELRDPTDVLGQRVQILGVAARKSDVEDAKWGAYMSLTVSVEGNPPEVMNTGAGQVAVTVWRLFCEGRLPATGKFVEYGAAKQGRNRPLGFEVDGEAF